MGTRFGLVPIHVKIRAPAGDLHWVPEKWATLLAENLRTGPRVFNAEMGRSAADKIELRLVGDDTTPVDFEIDELPEVMKALALMIPAGWRTAEAFALKQSFLDWPS